MAVNRPPAEEPGRRIVEVVAGIVVESGCVLLAQRTAAQLFAELWELPGGKIEPNEEPHAALTRELQEELGVTVAARTEYDCVRYRNPAGQDVRVRFYLADLLEGRPRPLEVAAVRWVAGPELSTLDLIPHNQPVATRLAADLEAGRF